LPTSQKTVRKKNFALCFWNLQTLLLCGALLAMTLIAYLGVWQNGFIDADDPHYITSNPHVRGGLTWSNVFWAFTTFRGAYWQPISWVSLQFDAQFFSPNDADGNLVPCAFHVHSLMWHCASALLLFLFWKRVTGYRWRSFVIAGFFALHPMHVESVAWAAERKDVLSVFFGICTLWAYLRYVEKPSRRGYFWLLLQFLLSLMAKPMLTTLPCVLLLLDYWPLKRVLWPYAVSDNTEGTSRFRSKSMGGLILEKLPLFCIALLVGTLALATRQNTGAPVPLSHLSLSARGANALTSYTQYLAATFFPFELAGFYQHPGENWALLPALGAGLCLVVITIVAVLQARDRSWLLVGWLWFVGTLLPVIGFLQGGEQARADRFTYWPHIGLFLTVSWAGSEAAARLRVPNSVIALAVALVLGFLTALSAAQVPYWHDTVTLWERVLIVAQDSPTAHVHLAGYYYQQGRLDIAQAYFSEACRLAPRAALLRLQLGEVLLQLGKLEEAAQEIRESVRLSPEDPVGWHALGLCEARGGRPREAIGFFRKAVELRPDFADSLARLGMALLDEGDTQGAIRSFQAALRKNADHEEALLGVGTVHLGRNEPARAFENFSLVLRNNPRSVMGLHALGIAQGRQALWSEAVESHRMALQLATGTEQHLRQTGGVPDRLDREELVGLWCRLGFALDHVAQAEEANGCYREASKRDQGWPRKYMERAWVLATSADPGRRDCQLAFELASQACRGAEPGPEGLDVLAAAQAALGNFRDATETAKRAAAKAEAAGAPELSTWFRGRLRHYERGERYVVPDREKPK
jgi:tetratricopeptide (TPR) repeat protein